MNKLILYGDSNTYGYDPRGFIGMRYPAEIRWADLISRSLEGKFLVVNEGMNGRPLPQLPGDEAFLEVLTRDLGDGDILLMMLGINDILLTNRPDAEIAIRKMESLLSYLKLVDAPYRLIVVGPPYIGTPDGEMHRYYDESRKMNKGFGRLCEARGVDYIDAAEWNIPLAFDLAHFSEAGHSLFAKRLLEAMDELKESKR